MQKYGFYAWVLDSWIVDRSASILVIGAGSEDRVVLQSLGFNNVVLSDVSSEVERAPKEGFRYEYQEAENIQHPDGSFDFVIANAMLHHCSSPHRAVLEMYRVARKGIIAVEARDSATMRLATRLGFASSYEVGSVRSHHGLAGGVNNTQVPNYIYRWTEREFEKTINTYAPAFRHEFRFRHSADPGPIASLRARRGPIRLLGLFAHFAFGIFTTLFPRQRNHLAMFVRKPRAPEDLQPWMKLSGDRLEFDLSYQGEG